MLEAIHRKSVQEGCKKPVQAILPFETALARPSFLRNHYQDLVTSLEMGIDYLTLFATFLGARWLYRLLDLARFSDVGRPGLEHLSHLFLLQVAVACGMTVLLFRLMGLYTKKISLLNIDQMRRLFQSILLLTVLVFAVSFYFRIPYSRMLITTWLLLTLLVMSIEKALFYKVHQHLYVKGLNVKRTVIYGAGEIGRKFYKKITFYPKLGYRAIGFLDDEVTSFAEEINRMEHDRSSVPRVLGTSRDLERVVREFGVDELLIAHKNLSSEQVLDLTNRCRQLGIGFKIIPQLLGHFIENLSLQDIGGLPLIGEKQISIPAFDLAVKRAMDIVFSAFACLFFLPLFLLLVALIKLDSPGPAIFRQKRVGKGGKEFTMHKFRTMRVDAPAYSPCPKDSHDPRITRVGRFLRKTSLDELPQFLNVLRGEMSLVGPRPEMPFIVATYNPLHRKRLTMKPGITGLWQISADRSLAIHDNIDYDIYYVDNFSILLDIAIIARTILYALIAMKTA
ncbi:MAG: sugar transferase [bacterium]